MVVGDLINVQPRDLKFPFELRKQSSCSMQLTNKTDKYVAFKVKTTNPKKYSVRPNSAVISPGGICNVTIMMQAPKETPADMQCKDKFLVQSIIAPDGATNKDVTAEMFNRENGKVFEEFKLRVIYIPANPPSPVPEEPEEETESAVENGMKNPALFEAVTKSLEEQPREKSFEAWTMVSKLTEEKASALQQNQKLRQELDLLRKVSSKNQDKGYSLFFVALIGLLGLLVGYLMTNSVQESEFSPPSS